MPLSRFHGPELLWRSAGELAAEILINSVNVVDDPCRTSWTGSCAAGGTQGIWTFRELMTRMAGAGSPQVLTAEWLHQWEIPRS